MPEASASGNIDVPVELSDPRVNDGPTVKATARIFVWGPEMKKRMAALIGCTWDELPTQPEEVPAAVAHQLRQEGYEI